jgi:hypothetical protein
VEFAINNRREAVEGITVPVAPGAKQPAHLFPSRLFGRVVLR